MIGNDYEKDIIPSKMVGMRTILYSEDSGEPRGLADFVIKSMDEILIWFLLDQEDLDGRHNDVEKIYDVSA